MNNRKLIHKYGLKNSQPVLIYGENKIEELLQMAEKTGAKIEIISTETTEGEQFLNITKDGIGAILRWEMKNE